MMIHQRPLAKTLRVALVLLLLALAACSRPSSPETPTEAARFGDDEVNGAVLELAETVVGPIAAVVEAPPGWESALPNADDAASAMPALSGYVAYAWYAPAEAHPWQLYLADQRSGATTRVYEGEREIQSVAVSLDGDTLVLSMRETAEPQGRFAIYRLQLSTGAVTRLTATGTDETYVSMSADGRTVVWEGESPEGRRAVFIRDYGNNDSDDSSASERMLSARIDQLQPRVSGDGGYIAMLFASGSLPSGRYQVVLHDREAGAYLGVFSSDGVLERPSVSSGGARVAWLERPSFGSITAASWFDPAGLRHRVRVRDLTSGRVTTAVSGLGPIAHPQLAADGEFLIYGQPRGSGWSVQARHLRSGQEMAAAVKEAAQLFAMHWQKAALTPSTRVAIQGEAWLINGQVTHPGTAAEGLLLNSRMVQATFDDANPETVGFWSYPDGSSYDPDRQTDEFIAAVPDYAAHGLRAVNLNFQGGLPARARGEERNFQPWENTAFNPDGSFRPAYLSRMDRAIRALDENGMVAIVGYFYFGQDHRLKDEAAVLRAVDDATDWLLSQGYTNVVVEINNEADLRYDHEILKEGRVQELIERVQERSEGRFLVSTSFKGGSIPTDAVLEASDFILLHGNLQDAEGIRRMVRETRSRLNTAKPIVFKEDSTSLENFNAAVEEGASWGYYDFGRNNYHDGFQSPPTNWSINTRNKRAFFERVRELTTPQGE